MQIASSGDNLHEISVYFLGYGDNLHKMLKPTFWENKKNTVNLSPAEFAKRQVKAKQYFPKKEVSKHFEILITFLKSRRNSRIKSENHCGDAGTISASPQAFITLKVELKIHVKNRHNLFNIKKFI